MNPEIINQANDFKKKRKKNIENILD